MWTSEDGLYNTKGGGYKMKRLEKCQLCRVQSHASDCGLHNNAPELLRVCKLALSHTIKPDVWAQAMIDVVAKVEGPIVLNLKQEASK